DALNAVIARKDVEVNEKEVNKELAFEQDWDDEDLGSGKGSDGPVLYGAPENQAQESNSGRNSPEPVRKEEASEHSRRNPSDTGRNREKQGNDLSAALVAGLAEIRKGTAGNKEADKPRSLTPSPTPNNVATGSNKGIGVR